MTVFAEELFLLISIISPPLVPARIPLLFSLSEITLKLFEAAILGKEIYLYFDKLALQRIIVPMLSPLMAPPSDLYVKAVTGLVCSL